MSLSYSASATVAVEKATSDLLRCPDWSMNLAICDSIISTRWEARDVVKALKRKLQHKNPKVHLFSVTLLETMVNNCADYVHIHIAEKNILGEMIKIAKKTDVYARDKIVALLGLWNESFGGAGGKHPQYYWACEELRRCGVEFSKGTTDSSVFKPTISNRSMRQTPAGFGLPSNSSRRLNERMATETESLSRSSMDSTWNILDLLCDMLHAVNLEDSEAIKDEVIVDLVDQCQAYQKRLVQMLISTSNEELLVPGLELNDNIQYLLAKYDAMVSGSPIPYQFINLGLQCFEVLSLSHKPTEIQDPNPANSSPKLNPEPSSEVASETGSQNGNGEKEYEYSQLAERTSEVVPIVGQSSPTGTGEDFVSMPQTSESPSNALALVNTDAPVITSKEDDMIELLSMALSMTSASNPVKSTKGEDMIDLLGMTSSTTSDSSSTTSDSPLSSHNLDSEQNKYRVQVAPGTQGSDRLNPSYFSNQGQLALNNYVVPWAQPQSELKPPCQQVLQPQQLQYPHYAGYPTPPWAASSVYSNSPNNMLARKSSFLPCATTSTASAILPPATVQKPYIPSYKLFEELDVMGNLDPRLKMTSSSVSSSLGGTSGNGLVSGGQ